MFDAVPMVRVRIQVPAGDAAAATHAVARLGLLHLIDVAHGRTDAAPPGSAELLRQHRELRDRTARTLERLGVPPLRLSGSTDAITVRDFDVERCRIETELAAVEHAVDEAWTGRATALAGIETLEGQTIRAAALADAGIELSRLRALRFASVVVAAAPGEALASLSAYLSPTPHLIEPLDHASGEQLAIVAVPASARSRLEAAERLVHVGALDASAMAPAGDVADLQVALDAARARADARSADLRALAEAHGTALQHLLARAETCLLLLQAQTRFGVTGRFIVISGWIPQSDSARLAQAVAAVAPRAVIDIEAPGDVRAPAGVAGIPILHRNPVLLRPFQPLVEMYDTPSYSELQPTAFFAISFLLMFGLMFGDVGHGAVLASAGYCLFRYMPRFLDYGILLMEAGAASAAFGVLYGSFFGIEGALPVLWLEPARDLPAFMRTAITVGVVLVSGGLILNVVNSWRLGERAEALLGLRGMFGAFLYWTALGLAARMLMPGTVVAPPWLIGALAMGAAVLVVLRQPLIHWLTPAAERPRVACPPAWLRALEGSVELVDSLFAYFANTISFIRIAAFAAVHAGVLVAIFAVADTVARQRFGGPMSAIVLVLGNLVLILLEGLTVSIQVLRLEYYEFFGKFFRGGGQAYRPLMLRPTTTKGDRP